VVVFLDYQNVFMGARRAFCGLVPGPTDGQVDPLRLARWLVADSYFEQYSVDGSPMKLHRPR
jgi:hypothetical protein